MLNVKQLGAKVSDYLERRLDLEDLEDWFSVESWNVHKWGSPAVDRAVFDVEAVFSKYHFEGVSELELRHELAGTIAAFPLEDDVIDMLEDVSRDSPILAQPLGEAKKQSDVSAWGVVDKGGSQPWVEPSSASFGFLRMRAVV